MLPETLYVSSMDGPRALSLTPVEDQCARESRSWARLDWNGRTVELSAGCDMSTIPLAYLGREMRILTSRAASTASIFQTCRRLESAALADGPLVPRAIIGGANERHNVGEYLGLGSRFPAVETFVDLEALDGIFGEACGYPLVRTVRDSTRTPLGWFAPDAGPEIFGAPYLVPAISEGAEETWELRHAGLVSSGFGLVRSTPWGNAEGVMGLVSTVVGADLDYVRATAFLADPESYRQDEEWHAYPRSLSR